MNKGIVIDVQRDYSFVLADGAYYRVQNKKNMQAGMEILFTEEDMVGEEKRSRTLFYRYASAAAVFILVLLFGVNYYSSNLAVFAIVAVDINPSLEVELNRDNEVIDVTAMNQDGEALLDVDVEGMDIGEAIALLVAEAREEGFIKNDEDPFVAVTTVATQKDAEERAEEIETIISDSVTQNSLLGEVTIAVLEGTEEDLEEALEEGKPLALVTLQKEGKAEGIQTVKELKGNADKLQEMAQEGQLYNKRYGQSMEEDKRNDLIVFDLKVEAALSQAEEGDVDIPEELKEAYTDAKDPKEVKEAAKDILALLEPEEEDTEEDEEDNGSEDDLYDDGPLPELLADLMALEGLDENQEERLEIYLDRLEDAGMEDLGAHEDGSKTGSGLATDQELHKEGRQLLNDLRKELRDAAKDAEKTSDEETEERTEDGPETEDVDDGQNGNGQSNSESKGNGAEKSNNGNSNKGKKDSDVEESVAEDDTEEDEDADEEDEETEEDGKENDDEDDDLKSNGNGNGSNKDKSSKDKSNKNKDD